MPLYLYGTTPAFLLVRNWTDMAAGDPFTERDVRSYNQVCVIGQTLVRELFGGQSPVGKEIRVQNVSFQVIGVLQTKGANMMGMDQDDILLAPWTTIKYRVVGASLANQNQSSATSQSSTSADQTAAPVNTLSQMYPNTQQNLSPTPSTTQQADTPQPVRFVNVDQILVAARASDRIPAAMQQVTELLRERHHIRPGEPDDFTIRDMTEITNTVSSTTALMTKLLLGVAMISLVVGGVGIMNIMLVSVTGARARSACVWRWALSRATSCGSS